jgi:thioredoxin reductase
MIEIAIIGAGPYGLSIAAYLRRQGIPFRIFGKPMDSWKEHMPKGMHLKSEGFASNIYDPDGQFTLERFCADRGIEYADVGMPIRLETFAAYGLAFKDRWVPELEDKILLGLERQQGKFVLRLEDGERVEARRVILAVGITNFGHPPSNLAHLPAEFLSHSYRHHELQNFKGRKVAVIGGGSSATDLAGLLHEADCDVSLVARQTALNFPGKPTPGEERSLWQRIRHPQSGLGPGVRSRFYSDAPLLFHSLPAQVRLKTVRTHLGPSGGWFIKDKVMGKVPLFLGYTPERMDILEGQVHLHLRAKDGAEREIVVDHVIAATGYKVDIERLMFLSQEIRSNLRDLDGSPVLSRNFESSVPGLYFVGVAAANSFGPLMRFAFGGGFTARHITQVIAKSLAHSHSSVAVPDAVGVAK